ncbi:PaaX family transcriptional regulator C-terminal domain-containing protein [Actinomadura sp. HBU206391]|uniref:PaaX family transcriptional regulator n=1 Tax=Actinomadura sp. HBU206391 TaxID=2731692 RepID=UPI00164F690C|nr:PaaX family transcriptional regulator C-terminal domain-containing protein [Actinomadura sp. HBU206391]MBC6461002.1 PaaX family transcriptional regulator [Actinomadura sp. HBU206391]
MPEPAPVVPKAYGSPEPEPEPELDRRREIGAASARSLLLTVLGEFVLPAGRPVWSSTFLRALALVGVEEKAGRQALARGAADGWLASDRHGRRRTWRLTSAGRRLLSQGTERIYGFGAPVAAWDGRWLVVLASVPEADRRLRHLLRTRLAWNGFGNLSPGVWVSPHPERQTQAREVLDQAGVAETSTIFVGELGFEGAPGDTTEARRVAGRAWALAEVELAYETFLTEVRRLRPVGPEATLAAQIRLVQEWRRFPFLDPGLPPELLPPGWSGTRAAALFHDRHAAWKPVADDRWREMAEEA